LRSVKVIDLATDSQEKLLNYRDRLSNLQHKFFPNFFHLVYNLGLFSLLTPINKLINREAIQKIESEDLDLVFYPTTSNLSFLAKTPAVVTIHDLHHRKTPEFLETSAGGRWEFREYTYKNIFKMAKIVLAESEFGKKDIIKYYRFDPERIIVLKMLPPSYLNPRVGKRVSNKLKKRFEISDKYLFYPAKFWPHKNHIRIIKALARLKRVNITPDLVLSGSKNADFGTFEAVMSLSEKLKVKKQIKYVGYVSNEEMSALYKNSLALIMPTFFGPSNIPLLEAWKIGTPAIYTNIEGCSHELGDAGLPVNPKSITDIASKIKMIYKDDTLRRTLSRKGKKRISERTEKEFSKTIKEVVLKY
jgi:glycosyltransferase involved in cell wall biosynthesis